MSINNISANIHCTAIYGVWCCQHKIKSIDGVTSYDVVRNMGFLQAKYIDLVLVSYVTNDSPFGC